MSDTATSEVSRRGQGKPTEFDRGMIAAAFLLWRGHGDNQMATYILEQVGWDVLSRHRDPGDLEMIDELMSAGT